MSSKKLRRSGRVSKSVPVLLSPAERPLELVLECGSCGETVTLLNGDYEFDVCAIHRGLVRYCTDCG